MTYWRAPESALSIRLARGIEADQDAPLRDCFRIRPSVRHPLLPSLNILHDEYAAGAYSNKRRNGQPRQPITKADSSIHRQKWHLGQTWCSSWDSAQVPIQALIVQSERSAC